MTAIHGLWRFDGRDVATDFRRMDLALLRFGDSGHDTHSPDLGLTLGRRLHHCLPEDRFPVPPGRRYVVVGDVRLTERDDLARRLDLGTEVAQMPDAGIAAMAIEAWHENAFDRIYGAFAIAAWDTHERRLLLARDHLGLKPLFYHSSDRLFAFASMPNGLHALPDVPRGPNLQSIKRFLAGQYQSPGQTHYADISRVMPGHFLIVTPDRIEETRYWKPDLTPLRLRTYEDYVEALSERIDSAVAAALRGVGSSVGAHLSSGFDSTTVATTAARQIAQRGATVVAYTAAPRDGYDKRMPNRIVDESRLASATAQIHANMDHVIVRSDRTPMANLNRTASIYGLPVFNICNEWWFDAINDDAAKRGITVMLEAAFGNATISETGIHALPELLRSGRFFAWLKLMFDVIRKGEVGFARAIWNSFGPWIPKPLYCWLIDRRFGAAVDVSRGSALRERELREVMLEAAREAPVEGMEERILSNGWTRPSGKSLDNRLLFLAGDDSGPSCKGMLGEWKIDYRDPTTDRRLVEFSLRVPAEVLMHGGQERAPLRKILADRVPAEILNNQHRGYQAADWHEWLDQARDEISEEVSRIEMFGPSAELIDVKRLKALLDEWPESASEKWVEDAAIEDYRCCLLRAISAASFMRQASGSNY